VTHSRVGFAQHSNSISAGKIDLHRVCDSLPTPQAVISAATMLAGLIYGTKQQIEEESQIRNTEINSAETRGKVAVAQGGVVAVNVHDVTCNGMDDGVIC